MVFRPSPRWPDTKLWHAIQSHLAEKDSKVPATNTLRKADTRHSRVAFAYLKPANERPKLGDVDLSTGPE
jgi:hypothetical protein